MRYWIGIASMWQGKYEATTDVSAEALFRAITDINNWNKWDHGLEFTKLEGVAKQGAHFILKPKGGPNVKMTIDEIQHYRLIDTETPKGDNSWNNSARMTVVLFRQTKGCSAR